MRKATVRAKAADFGHLRLVALTSALLIAAAVLGGCNTVDGMGRDAEAAGEAVQDEF